MERVRFPRTCQIGSGLGASGGETACSSYVAFNPGDLKQQEKFALKAKLAIENPDAVADDSSSEDLDEEKYAEVQTIVGQSINTMQVPAINNPAR